MLTTGEAGASHCFRTTFPRPLFKLGHRVSQGLSQENLLIALSHQIRERRDLDRLQEATIDKDGKRITTRTPVAGQVGRVFQAAGVALPPNTRERAT